MSHAEIRSLCQTEAMKWVDVQRTQFRRLGVLGDWDHPYLTLDPRYEAGILDVLADLVEGGYVGRQLKPIHWCMTDRTALAEAELEYHEETTPSIYVNFPMVSGVPEGWPSADGRVAVARDDLDDHALDAAGQRRDRRPSRPDLRRRPVHRAGDGQTVRTILAADLVAKVMGLGRVTEFAEVGRCRGRELEHARVSPPVHRPRQPDRAGQLRQRRGRHRAWCIRPPATVPRTTRPAGPIGFRS